MVEIDEPTQVKVSSGLIKKLIIKLKLSPETPAVYVVDTTLRQALEK